MAAFTPYLNLYKPGGGSSGLITPDEVVDIDRINADFDILDANALSQFNRSKNFPLTVADNAARDAWFTAPAQGDRVFNRSLGMEQVYGANGWQLAVGLIPVRPSSVVTSGSNVINADGSVDFAALSVMALNGVFSSKFRNYLIEVDAVFSADNGWSLRLRSAGVDDSGANQYKYGIRDSSSSASGTEGQSNSLPFAGSGATYKLDKIDVSGPAVAAVRTSFVWIEAGTPSAGTTSRVSNGAGTHATPAAYDGFSLNIAGATATGNVRVYGYA